MWACGVAPTPLQVPTQTPNAAEAPCSTAPTCPRPPPSAHPGTLILSQAIGPLLAAGFLSMDGMGGLMGWQWLFLIEGCLAILVAVGW